MDPKKLSGLGRHQLLKMIESMHAELKQIDDILFDSIHGDVDHQIDCHMPTLPVYTRHLAETLKKIDAVGRARLEAEMDEIDPPKPPDVIV
jgi:hypothetical protein